MLPHNLYFLTFVFLSYKILNANNGGMFIVQLQSRLVNYLSKELNHVFKLVDFPIPSYEDNNI